MRDWDCVLFDLDGTLIDTEPSAARAIQEAFSAWGHSVLEVDAAQIAGRTWQVAFDYLFKIYPAPIPRADAERKLLEHYRAEIEKNLIVIPGAVAAVQALASRYRLGLVSGSYRKEILWALGRLGILDHFQVILGAEDYLQSKPAPDGYRAAIQQLQADPGSVLIFEDSHAGITSGKQAGARVVAIDVSNHFGHDTSHADAHVRDLTLVTPEWALNLRSSFQSKFV